MLHGRTICNTATAQYGAATFRKLYGLPSYYKEKQIADRRRNCYLLTDPLAYLPEQIKDPGVNGLDDPLATMR